MLEIREKAPNNLYLKIVTDKLLDQNCKTYSFIIVFFSKVCRFNR